MNDKALVSEEQAIEALESMDDFARMDSGVDARGARELLRRFITQAALGVGGWRPMDSAPRDGTRIIASTSWGVEVVKWCDGATFDQFGPGEGWIGVEQDSTCLPPNYRRDTPQCPPTSWQPIPPPPSSEEG